MADILKDGVLEELEELEVESWKASMCDRRPLPIVSGPSESVFVDSHPESTQWKIDFVWSVSLTRAVRLIYAVTSATAFLAALPAARRALFAAFSSSLRAA
jgi:hypothetical protein